MRLAAARVSVCIHIYVFISLSLSLSLTRARSHSLSLFPPYAHPPFLSLTRTQTGNRPQFRAIFSVFFFVSRSPALSHKHTHTHTHVQIKRYNFRVIALLVASSRTTTHCNTLQHTVTHCNTLQLTAVTHYNALQLTAVTLQHTATHCTFLHHRLIGSRKVQIIFHKRATKYRSLLRKMTYKDKGS